MSTQIYIFAGFPGKQDRPGSTHLHAGGLQHCIENVEKIGILEHDSSVQVRKEGVFVVAPSGAAEQIADIKMHLSDQLIETGITDNWFQDNWTFGNGATRLKSTATYETKVVNHECGRTLEELLAAGGVVDFSALRLQQIHDRKEGWDQYEARWRAGTCPQYTHILDLTWLVMKHELNAFAYRRILALIEQGASVDRRHYDGERHFRTLRTWDGKPAFNKGDNALPLL